MAKKDVPSLTWLFKLGGTRWYLWSLSRYCFENLPFISEKEVNLEKRYVVSVIKYLFQILKLVILFKKAFKNKNEPNLGH